MFLKVLREYFLPAIDAGSFTGPDGRATFHLDRDETGHTVLVWRRIGTHDI
jgi:hypothetical protein